MRPQTLPNSFALAFILGTLVGFARDTHRLHALRAARGSAVRA